MPVGGAAGGGSLKAGSAHALVEGLDLGPEFLATKIAPPHVGSRWIARQRLLARIGVPPAKQLVLVNAPAGFGKTSLLAAWSRELSLAGIRPAWLSVDAHDADLHHFFGYVAAALNAAEPAIGSDVIELVGRRGRAVQPTLVVHLLLDSIAAHPGRVVLVIDDYHAAAGTAIDQALSDLVVHAPPNFHVVIAGRGAPPLRLARLRAADQVLELSPEDLAFDQDEVRAFFVRTSGFALAPQEVAQLRAFSEGWPACLQFAAISMRRKQDLARVLRAPRSPAREIASYLRDDVLQGIEPELRSFLARTSILERFNSALAGAVAGVANARSLIEASERRQLFLISLDDRGEWFRYHALFASCLREVADREMAGELPELHRKACEWFAGEQLWSEAVRHAMAAGDADRALAIVEECAMDFVRRGDFLTLTGLLQSFPDGAWRQSVPLQIAYAWALAYCGAAAGATAVLADVESRSAAMRLEERRHVESSILLIRLTIAAITDDTESCIEFLGQADPALGDHDAWASDIVNAVAAFVHLNAGETRRAREFLPCLHPFKRVYQQFIIALSWLREGRPLDTERELARAQELALGEFGARSISNLVCLAALAPLQYERGDFDAIELGLGNRLGMLDEVAPTDCVLMGYVGLAWSRVASGRFAEAEALLHHLREMCAKRHWLRGEAWALLELIRFRIARGAPDLDDLAPRCREIGVGNMPAARSTRSEAILCARLGAAVCAALSRVDTRSLDDLAAIVEQVNGAANVPLAVKANLLFAYTCFDRGATERARFAMGEALRLARSAQMMRSVDNSGAWARDLAAGLSGATGGPESAGSRPASETVAPQRSVAGLADDLSQREREVLRLVERGLSNKEIAKALQIAPETVKWHVKNLFAKLGVTNRMQAVNRMRAPAPLG